MTEDEAKTSMLDFSKPVQTSDGQKRRMREKAIEAAAKALWEGGLLEDDYDSLPESGKRKVRVAVSITLAAYHEAGGTVAVEPTEAMRMAGRKAAEAYIRYLRGMRKDSQDETDDRC